MLMVLDSGVDPNDVTEVDPIAWADESIIAASERGSRIRAPTTADLKQQYTVFKIHLIYT